MERINKPRMPFLSILKTKFYLVLDYKYIHAYISFDPYCHFVT